MSKAAALAEQVNTPAAQTTQPPANQAPTTIAQFLAKNQKMIKSVLPKHITPERMSRIALAECRKTPDLLKCDPQTLFGAIVTCSQMGLEPGAERGLAYLLPFNNRKLGTVDVTLIIGYKGFVEMGWRSGMIKSISANPVYSNDEFDYQEGTDPYLRHKPKLSDRGDLVAAYCAIQTTNGGEFFKVVGPDDIAKAKQSSGSANSKFSPWTTHESEMWVKTAIRRCYKLAPLSAEIQRAVSLDEMADAGLSQHNESVFEGEFEVEHKQPEAVQDEAPAPVTTPPAAEAYKKLEQLIKVAKSLDDLDELLIMQEWDSLAESEAQALQVIVNERREAIQQ